MLVLDSDSLIKLNQVGALALVAQSFECIIPRQVYQEAVVNARASGYLNEAEERDRIIMESIQVRDADPRKVAAISNPLGAGENEVLVLAQEIGAEAVIVSDDRQFLNRVRAETEITALEPIELVPLLAMGAVISITQASEFIEVFGLLTTEASYQIAKADLEGQTS